MLSGGTPSAWEMAGTAVFRMVESSDSMKNATATSQGRSRLADPASSSSGACDGCIHDGLRVTQDLAQMIAAAIAFAINLINVLGAGRARGKPATLAHHLDAAEGS